MTSTTAAPRDFPPRERTGRIRLGLKADDAPHESPMTYRFAPSSKEQGSTMPAHRLGAVLAITGALLTLAGAALYVLPGPGLPLLVLGLTTLTAGLATFAATRRHQSSSPRSDRNPELT
jgi:hypothetical protein